ncbi:uncharacterized protein LOC102154731 isoform X13 [Canis lupus familiaris]|uniref:uncharacterized protein LOC102154731 isoform X13 n=1 Tax=Canis lupus familiaris TaxID=9615 RepID=UPI0018F5C22E|nr:uncharacterized protein LOC102154731 isoform X13 [Canis lupus familiaris]
MLLELSCPPGSWLPRVWAVVEAGCEQGAAHHSQEAGGWRLEAGGWGRRDLPSWSCSGSRSRSPLGQRALRQPSPSLPTSTESQVLGMRLGQLACMSGDVGQETILDFALFCHLKTGTPENEKHAALLHLLSFFFKDFIYLFIHERHTEREAQRHRQREKQAPCREPDVGLDPGSPGSHPRLQAALNRCATGAALHLLSVVLQLLPDEKTNAQKAGASPRAWNFSITKTAVPWIRVLNLFRQGRETCLYFLLSFLPPRNRDNPASPLQASKATEGIHPPLP